MSRYSDTSNIGSNLYFTGIDPRAARSMSGTHPGGRIEDPRLDASTRVTGIGYGSAWGTRSRFDTPREMYFPPSYHQAAYASRYSPRYNPNAYTFGAGRRSYY
jgi:hypothetical protein